MSVRKSAPAGYESAYAAMLDLIRFGFQVWGPSKMAVLLYHAERSVSWGKDSDQHSQAQATRGIRRTSGELIRGAAGVSPATWHRTNAELTAAGILRRERRKRWNTGDDATEYAIDWLAVRAEISSLKAHQYSEATSTGVSHHETHSNYLLQLLTSTVSECSNTSKSSEASDTGVLAVRDSLTAAYGAELPPDDPIPGQLLELSRRMRLPDEALLIWIAGFAADKRAKNYPITSPQLFFTAAPKGLQVWQRNNGPLLARIGAAANAARSRPPEPPLEMRPCAHCGAVPGYEDINGQPICLDCSNRLASSPIDNPAKIGKKKSHNGEHDERRVCQTGSQRLGLSAPLRTLRTRHACLPHRGAHAHLPFRDLRSDRHNASAIACLHPPPHRPGSQTRRTGAPQARLGSLAPRRINAAQDFSVWTPCHVKPQNCLKE